MLGISPSRYFPMGKESSGQVCRALHGATTTQFRGAATVDGGGPSEACAQHIASRYTDPRKSPTTSPSHSRYTLLKITLRLAARRDSAYLQRPPVHHSANCVQQPDISPSPTYDFRVPYHSPFRPESLPDVQPDFGDHVPPLNRMPSRRYSVHVREYHIMFFFARPKLPRCFGRLHLQLYFAVFRHRKCCIGIMVSTNLSPRRGPAQHVLSLPPRATRQPYTKSSRNPFLHGSCP